MWEKILHRVAPTGRDTGQASGRGVDAPDGGEPVARSLLRQMALGIHRIRGPVRLAGGVIT